MGIYEILFLFGAIILFSHLFNVMSNKMRLPSAAMLIFLGILGQFISYFFQIPSTNTVFLLDIIGSFGLMMIILEGALEIKIERNSLSVAIRAFLVALGVFAGTTILLASVFVRFMDLSLLSALVYAIPLSIISSSMAVPSIAKLSKEKKDFILYESVFSDIIGIIVFNYVIQINDGFSLLFQITSDVILSGFFLTAGIIILVIFLKFTGASAKFIPLLGLLLSLYALGKMWHLPSLLLVLGFGLLANNLGHARRLGNLKKHLDHLHRYVPDLKSITIEMSFLVRTFFFVLLGFTLSVSTFSDIRILGVGSLVFFIILFVRYAVLQWIRPKHIFPELFIAPRGLVTMILFFSIPSSLRSPNFSDGVVYFVLIVSSVVMTAALVITHQKYKETPESVTH